MVAHGSGGEAVQNAHEHRLHLIAVDEVAAHRHRRIHQEDHAEHVLLGVVLVNDGGNKVRSAGKGAGLYQHRIAEPDDDTRGEGSDDPAGAVGGGVGKGGKVHIVQQQQAQGKGHHIQHAPYSQGLADCKIDPECQRDIDQQAEIAHADPGDILDHRTDTVYPGGGKLIGKHEKLIAYRRHHRDGNNGKVCPDLFQQNHSRSRFSSRRRQKPPLTEVIDCVL